MENKKSYYKSNPKTKEYQDNYMRKIITCSICNVQFSYSNKSHHAKSKKHLEKLKNIN